MRMFGDKEIDLVEDFRVIPSEQIAVIGNEEEIDKIIDIIKISDNWIDSSGKDQLPPDFYNDKDKIMMEVMRVDDHGYRKHGKTINPTYRKENQIRKELEEKGFDKLFPNAKLFVNANTGLPTKEDHNYSYYYNNFQRTIKKHCDNIQNYKKNHRNYKLIFFIYDESTAYIDAESRNGRKIYGRFHYYFFDKKFVECFIKNDIDYLIWMTPYKRYEYELEELQPPKAIVYDIKNISSINNKLIHYDEKRMVSSEK